MSGVNETEEIEFRLFCEIGVQFVMRLDDPGVLSMEGIRPIAVSFSQMEDPNKPGQMADVVSATTTRRAKGERLDTLREMLSSDEARREAPNGLLNKSPMIYPMGQAEFLRSVEVDLMKAIRQTADALRWRRNVFGDHRTLARTGHVEFRLRDTNWAHCNLAIPGSVMSVRNVVISPVADVSNMVSDSNFEIPLAHQLYMEAAGLLTRNPRSALTILIAAIESSVKNCIRKIAPEAAWLVEHVPSPPVVDLLTQYLPTLLSDQEHVEILQELIGGDAIQILKSAIQQRNDLVHGVRSTVDHNVVQRCALLAHDLLWTLEYLSGTEWAREHIGRNPRKWASFEESGPNTWRTGFH